MPYTDEDYILFFLAIILAFGGLALLGAIIEWWEKRQAQKKFREDNKQAFQLPRRRSKTYVQEWDEVLESLQGKKSA